MLVCFTNLLLLVFFDRFGKSPVAFALLFAFIFPLSILAQDKKKQEIEDLKSKIEKSADDSPEKANIACDLCWKLRNSDLESALSFCKKAVELAGKHQDFALLAKAYSFTGVVYRNMADYSLAMEYYFKGLEVAEKHNVTVQIGYAFNNIGELYRIQDDNEQAFKYTNKAIDYLSKADEAKGVAYAYMRLAEIYLSQKKHEQALAAFTKSLDIRRELKDEDAVGSSLYGIATVYLDMQNFSKAIEYLLQVQEMSKGASNDKRISGVLNSLARAYMGLSDFATAEKKLDEAVNLAKELDAKEYLADAYATQSELYQKTENYQKAFDALKKYSEVKNEMLRLSEKKQSSVLKSTYDLKQKQIELEAERAERKLLKRFFYAGGAALLVVVLLLSYIFFSRRKLQKMFAKVEEVNRQVEVKNADLLEASAKLHEQNEQIQHQNELLATSEEELKQNMEQVLLVQAQLESQNSVLKQTLEELQSAQNQLIQAEKMASLGQLVASIAHEINTPLGAIRSSTRHALELLDDLLKKFPAFINTLAPSQIDLFEKLSLAAVEKSNTLSTREKRQIKYEMIDFFQNIGTQNAEEIADIVSELNLSEEVKQKQQEVVSLEHPFVFFKELHNLVGARNSNRNILAAVERVAKIVFALKSFSRQNQKGEKVKTDLLPGIYATIDLYQNQIKQGIELMLNLEPLPEVMCYADEIVQVWSNLIHNAIQAMNGKGILTVTAKKLEKDILISFQDTGTGIPEDIRHRIFDPFFTTKKTGEGSGLGLDIVKKIVEKHGGDIYFETESGKGTTFFVTLPLDA